MALYEKYVWNSTTNAWDLVVNPDSLFYIAGTGSTAGTWLGSHSRIGEYYDGLTIAYKIPIAGASTTTLNINGLGARTVRRNTGNLTTHLPANTVVVLTYTTISSVGYWVWADYDANSNSSLMTQAAIDTGTETTAREINALLLRNNFYLKSEADALLNGKENEITKGTTAQYFRGDMSLATFPTIPTIPSIMTTTEGNTGTAATQRTISAANLKSIILNHSPAGSRPASDVSAWAKKSSLAIGDIPTGTTESTVALGNHTHSQYLTSFTESDPTVPSHVKGITAGNISSWNNKFNTPAGTTSQYIRGDGSLATFPTIPTIPSLMTQTDINNGTSTQRTINASLLKTNFYLKSETDTLFSEYIKRDGSVSMDSSLDMGGSDIDNISGIYFGTGSPFIVNESGDLRISLASGKYLKVDGVTDHMGNKAINLANPTNPQDAVNKNYVDNKWKLELLRSRSGLDVLTIHSNAAITGLGAQLSRGDTIMFEVLHTTGVTLATPKVITATVGSEANSTSHERSITYTTWNGLEQRVYSMSVALVSGNLTFGSANYMRMYKSGSNMIISNTAWTPYIGKVWKVVGV